MDDPTMIRFKCPKCKKSFHADGSAAGQTGQCSRCGQAIKVPHAKNIQTGILESPETVFAIIESQDQPHLVEPIPIGTCPFCQSTSTQKASAIYAAGTTYSSSNQSGTITRTQDVHSHYVQSSTSRYSQTVLAAKSSPPKRVMGVFGLFFCIYFLTLILSCCGAFGIGGIFAVFSPRENPPPDADELTVHWTIVVVIRLLVVVVPVVAAIASIPFGIKRTHWNWTVYPKLLEEWHRTWYCHRCGSFFLQQ